MEAQIESVLKDANDDLKKFKDLIISSTRDNGNVAKMYYNSKEKIENVKDITITKDHILNVLSSVKGKGSFKEVYSKNSAGITFAVQWALSALGYDDKL
ncbi:MAG: hypothetical protein GXP45_04970 [bacterium]|nr:hypothetical protein [bacterium]